MFAVDVAPGKDVIIDNSHVVAWDARLKYEISITTSQSGVVSSLISPLTSGEGMVLRFSGNGKVFVCSRNRNSFVQWIMAEAIEGKKTNQ